MDISNGCAQFTDCHRILHENISGGEQIEEAERAKAEKAQQKNEGMYRELVEFSPAGIYEVDLGTGELLSLNDAVCNLSGYSREELLKMSPYELLDEDGRLKLKIWHNQWKGEKVSPLMECRIRHKNGHYVDIQIQGYYISRECGKISRLVVMLIDISARKMAEKVLRENEERQACLLKFSDILRSLSDPVEIHATVTGTAMDHFKSDRCYYCEIEDDKAIIRKDSFTSNLKSMVGVYTLSALPVQKGLIEAGQSFSFSDVHTTEMVGDELREMYIQQKIISYLDIPVVKGGKAVGLLCIAQSTPRNWTGAEVQCAFEVAERTWAAVERAKSEEALRANEAKYRKLFDTSNDGFWWADQHGFITEASEGAAKMLGYSPNELVGKFWTNFVDDTWLDKGYEIWKARKAGQSNRYEIKLKKKDGSSIWAKVSGASLLNENGTYDGTLAAFTDITAQKAMEEELSKSEKKALALVNELEKADKNKNEFISVLSHELRNPLAAILAGMEVLDITKDARQKSKVKEIMNRQTNQLCKLVDDLLELTRINQNMIKLKRKIIDLNEAIKGVIEDFEYEFEMNGIELEAKIQTEQIMLYADPVRLTQAVGNLLNNALKFTHKGGKACLMLQQENEDAVILVQDNGIGIAPQNLPHLFTPFMQVNTSLERSTGGLGLGLSIVKNVVGLHGGTVCAHSEGLEMGASFSIRLPIVTDGTYRVEKQITSHNHQKNLNVLIIEDNRDFAEMLCTMLSTLDCCVTIAYDGEEGLRAARQNKPDVIFCDIGLPLRNGYDVAASIKQDIALNDIYLIALSGYAYEKDQELALKAGFDKHLAKPVDIAILKEVLKNNG